MTLRDIIQLILCIAFSQLAGVIGSIVTSGNISGWYQTLAKPAFQPPSVVFGPVWIVLYSLIGVTLYLVYRQKDIRALGWFIANWIVNIAWNITFFGLHNPLLALITIILLVGIICGMMNSFYRIDRRTLFLLAPYLAWVLFASILNAAIVALN